MKASLLVLAALGAAMAYAVPTGPDASSVMDATALDGGITLDLHVRNVDENEVLRSGMNLKRSSSLEKHQSVAVTNIENLDYYVRMSFGTPAQSFLLNINTGSPDLWVMGKDCGQDCYGSKKFNSSASSTFRTSNTPYALAYGSGRVRGKLATDTVGLAGYQLPKQSFGIVDRMESGLLGVEGSGIVGLRFGEASVSTGMSIWQALAKAGKIPAPLFTLRLGRPASSKGGKSLSAGGALTFGVVDPKQYAGPITYTNLAVAEDWIIQLGSIKVNGKPVALSKDRKENAAAIDSGASITVGPDTVMKAFHAQIPGSERLAPGVAGDLTTWTVPCDSTHKVSLDFSGKDWQLDPSDIKGRRAGKGKDGKDHCVSTFLGFGSRDLNDGGPAWIVGANFLMNVFAVFDGDKGGRIGFAQLK